MSTPPPYEDRPPHAGHIRGHDNIGRTRPRHRVRGRHRAVAHRSARGGARRPRPATVWPFADVEPLPGTALLAGWLGRAIVTLVTTYTRPGDRVLLLAPPPPRPAYPTARGGVRGLDPYAGLAEAVWTVTRLGRTADTATTTDTLDDPHGRADALGVGAAESGSGPRLGRLRLTHPTDPDRATEHRLARVGSSSGGRFNLIITAVHPGATDWLADTDWDTAMTPTGLLTVITHSDSRDGLLIDPTGSIATTICSSGRGWLDHIAVLSAPIPAARGRGTEADPLPAGEDSTSPGCGPLAVRSVHHDLLLFGPIPSLAAERKPEPSTMTAAGDLG
ncbi:hypothetical protein [Amycolatopsis sp. NPDC059657]|uniref:hypothetical protein n=1 Tax=Amycolatopsis sp. NPDC059657 TaxID=3346899 RepID=UPI003673248B